jgi:diguanylate cyclase (GGDEF)-like protein
MEEKNCNKIIEKLTHAYQPIVNMQTGTTLGFEALLRNFLELGFESIDTVFDFAYLNDNLFELDMNLRKKALKKLLNNNLFLFNNGTILFYNLDNRILTSKDYEFGKTIEFLSEFNIDASKVCFEISEKHYIECSDYLIDIMRNYKNQGFKIAIDDFGVKFSGLEYIYNFEPDFIKVDRFFISNINKNYKKKLFVEHIISLCSKLGIKTIAEGVETEQELKECKDMGFNFVQGYFVEKPQIDLTVLKLNYNKLNEIKTTRVNTTKYLIQDNLKSIEPVHINDSILDCLYRFKDESTELLPVVDNNSFPLGVIREKDLKRYAYSPFGKDLLKNRSYYKPISAIITKAPVACVNSSIEDIIENFVQTNDPDTQNIRPVIISKDRKYIGYLDAPTLISIIHKHNLIRAANQNPLTKLPGNNLIIDYIQDAIAKTKQVSFVYFDINKFKVFNDTFGFRQGDRIILLLADILQKVFNEKRYFVGHIGGDDFFVGCDLSSIDFNEVFTKSKEVQDNFNQSGKIFYPKEILDQGYIQAKDRDGTVKKFELISVSFALLCINQLYHYTLVNEEKISNILAMLKKEAKSSAAFCAASTFAPQIKTLESKILPKTRYAF